MPVSSSNSYRGGILSFSDARNPLPNLPVPGSRDLGHSGEELPYLRHAMQPDINRDIQVGVSGSG